MPKHQALRLVVRFDKLLTEVHIAEEKTTRCGEPMPNDLSVIWIDWTEDGTPHCAACFGEALQEEAMF